MVKSRVSPHSPGTLRRRYDVPGLNISLGYLFLHIKETKYKGCGRLDEIYRMDAFAYFGTIFLDDTFVKVILKTKFLVQLLT